MDMCERRIFFIYSFHFVQIDISSISYRTDFFSKKKRVRIKKNCLHQQQEVLFPTHHTIYILLYHFTIPYRTPSRFIKLLILD